MGATGHASRLSRDGITAGNHTFGDPTYSFEELVAEMGSAFLCAHVGIQAKLQHDSYIASWLKVLQQDKKAIFRASGLARNACEYLLTQLFTPESIDWLAADAAALSTLLLCLNGQYQYAGLAGELVQKADRASVVFNLGGDPVKAIHRPQTSLPQQNIAALRDLLAHEFRLNNPNGGSDGWLTEEVLWLVSKNAADAVRGWLLRQRIDAVPQHNVRLFDEMQARFP